MDVARHLPHKRALSSYPGWALPGLFCALAEPHREPGNSGVQREFLAASLVLAHSIHFGVLIARTAP